MPQQKRQEILALVAPTPWTREEYQRVQTAADKGEGFPAALLYALEGEKKYLAIPRNGSWASAAGTRARPCSSAA